MSEIKWVKLTTDMFDNRKIKAIRKEPEGNNIILIWVMLLTLAGRCNAGGMIFLTENIPYNLDLLSAELGFEEKVVALALSTLCRFGMLIADEETICIANWEEYQNVEAMEKAKESKRLAQARWRAKQKQIPSTVDSTEISRRISVDDAEEDIEEDKDIEIKENIKRKFSPPTLDDVSSYCSERGNHINPQRFIDYYEANGWMVGKVHMKDWKATIRNWEQRDGYSPNEETKSMPLPSDIRRKR